VHSQKDYEIVIESH